MFLCCFLYIIQVSAAEDVLVFYNERASFNTFVNMMKEDRNRMDYDDSSPLRWFTFVLYNNLIFYQC